MKGLSKFRVKLIIGLAFLSLAALAVGPATAGFHGTTAMAAGSQNTAMMTQSGSQNAPTICLAELGASRTYLQHDPYVNWLIISTGGSWLDGPASLGGM